MPNLPVASPVKPATVRLDAVPLSIFQAPLLIKLRTVVVGKTLTTTAPLTPAVPESTCATALLMVVVPCRWQAPRYRGSTGIGLIDAGDSDDGQATGAADDAVVNQGGLGGQREGRIGEPDADRPAIGAQSDAAAG